MPWQKTFMCEQMRANSEHNAVHTVRQYAHLVHHLYLVCKPCDQLQLAALGAAAMQHLCRASLACPQQGPLEAALQLAAKHSLAPNLSSPPLGCAVALPKHLGCMLLQPPASWISCMQHIRRLQAGPATAEVPVLGDAAQVTLQRLHSDQVTQELVVLEQGHNL